jgi:hypothetical protein
MTWEDPIQTAIPRAGTDAVALERALLPVRTWVPFHDVGLVPM